MGIPQEQADMLRAKMEAHRRGLETPQDGLSPSLGQSDTRKPGNQPYTASKRPPRMNKWEQAYSETELKPRLLIGELAWYGFEAIKLRLAGKTYYTPDFAVLRDADLVVCGTKITGLNPRVEFHEVKGHWRDDALVKFKVAAEQFPFARFLALRKRRVAEGGGWEIIKELNV